MQPLDPYRLPLSGIRLLEASAGTGKTYTLTLLYLRLIVERGLSVDEILVVTFTRAATDELRTRIRSRLREALDYFTIGNQQDKQLTEFLENVQHDTASQRLRDALVRMDEAAIFTIHSFCQRILPDNAFETGAPFTPEFLETEQPVQLQIMEDFWRNHFYSATREMADWISNNWSCPGELLAELQSSLSLPQAVIVPQITETEIATLAADSQSLWDDICRLWVVYREEVSLILEHDPCLKRSEKTYRHDKVTEIMAAMEELAQNRVFPYNLPKSLALLQQATITEHIKKKCKTPPAHLFFNTFEEFYLIHQQYMHHLRITIIQKARTYLLTELASRKAEQSWLFFDDLLTYLAKALDKPVSGPLLAARIAQIFPVALVDEFQDTDPLQYRIFSHIYQRDSPGSLFMIGDPKQAIYSFRGADIFTYIQARRQTPEDCRYTMGVNYRSSASMIRAVNTLFHQPDSFLFEPDISFYPVSPAPGAAEQSLMLHGSPALPLTALMLSSEYLITSSRSKSINKDTASQAAAAYCAEEIFQLLDASGKGLAFIETTPLTAGDIAVLVRTHNEAKLIQQALNRRGITSVYYSRESIFSTAEASQLYTVLVALLDLTDTGTICAALASDFFGCDGNTLAALRTHPNQWDKYLNRLQRYRQVWLDQGVMPMLQQLFASEQVVHRLSGLHGGDRKLTNYLHLMELLQQSPAGNHGRASLLRWFANQLNKPEQEAENQQIRLENDENLVRIVTIHKSKGLEYPIVFLPFLWSSRAANNKGPLIFHDRSTYNAVIDLAKNSEENKILTQQEQQAEAIRLLYVAMTRARCCCFFCWGTISSMEASALATLLHPDSGGTLPNEDAIIQNLEQLNSREQLIAIKRSPPEFPNHILAEEEALEKLQVTPFEARIQSGWHMTSYSQLTADNTTFSKASSRHHLPPMESEQEPFQDAFSFPRGATAGTCLHTIFEKIDFAASPATWTESITNAITQAGIDNQWQPFIEKWYTTLLSVQLPGSCPLQKITAGEKINELSFLFPLAQVDVSEFNNLLSQWNFAPLSTQTHEIKGMMKGFIDLVFLHNNRFYIADYKSNYLGPSPSDYTANALEIAMTEHRYDIQYLIYSLALHRFLASRLKEYSFGTHFGGIYYLFLRGMDPDYQQNNGIFFTRPAAELIDGLDGCFRGEDT